ncbi:MAG: hypothetical protein KKB70_00350 [Proteobacteria bacterium]|nr:hypothetical protein [Pseudomonadota bacterium]MBU1611916.1 hypothetical protein [Pseudomonadota bacterium]
MPLRLLAILSLAVVVLFFAWRASRQRTDALLAGAGLLNLPLGPRLVVDRVERPTRIIDGVAVALAEVKRQYEANTFTVIGTYRDSDEDSLQISRLVTERTVHLWVIFPTPYPVDFAFDAAYGEQASFSGEFQEMSELLGSQKVTSRLEELRAALAPLHGSLRLDQARLDVSLPGGTAVNPALVETTLELWRAIRDGSNYPYRADEG